MATALSPSTPKSRYNSYETRSLESMSEENSRVRRNLFGSESEKEEETGLGHTFSLDTGIHNTEEFETDFDSDGTLCEYFGDSELSSIHSGEELFTDSDSYEHSSEGPLNVEIAAAAAALHQERKWIEYEREQLDFLSKQIKKQKKIVSKCQTAHNESTIKVEKLKTEIHDSEQKIDEVLKKIRAKKKRIRKFQKYPDGPAREKERLKLQLKVAKENLASCKEKIKDDRKTIESLQVQFDEIGMDVKTVVDERTELHKELDIQQVKLSNLQAEDDDAETIDTEEELKSDPLYLLDHNYTFLQDDEDCSVDEIGNVENPKQCKDMMETFGKILQENIHRFKHLPKGPLFKNIMIRQTKWAPLVEYVLRPYFFSFVVDNIVDSLVMKELVEEHFPDGRPGVINSNGVVVPKHHIFPFKSQYRIPTRITAMKGFVLENMLECIYYEDDTWAKFLSEVMHIEKILFTENESNAFIILHHISTTEWTVDMAYSLDGFQVHPFPSFRSKQIKLWGERIYLRVLPNLNIGEILSKITKLEHNIKKLNHQINIERTAQLKIARDIDKARAQLKESRLTRQTCKENIKEAREMLKEPLSLTVDKAKLKYLKASLKRLRKRVAKCDLDIQSLTKSCARLDEKHDRESFQLIYLKEDLKYREETHFKRREAVWAKEDEMEKCYGFSFEI